LGFLICSNRLNSFQLPGLLVRLQPLSYLDMSLIPIQVDSMYEGMVSLYPFGVG
jgi:hypothetical protein